MNDYEWESSRYGGTGATGEQPCYAAPVFPAKAPVRPPAPVATSRPPVSDFNTTLYLPRKKTSPSRRCMGRLSRLEVFLGVLCLLLLLSLIATLFTWIVLLQGYRMFQEGLPFYPLPPHDNSSMAVDSSAEKHNKVVCTSRECVQMAGFLADNLNDKVDPCDDFYEFACGNYGLNRNLPSNKPLRHTISDVQSRLNKQVKSVLESKIDPSESRWDKLAKGYYQKCLDEDELDRTGERALKEVLARVGGWPLLEGAGWKEWSHGWEEQLAEIMNRTGQNAIILEMAVTHDPGNSSVSVIELDQPKWGVGSRWPYLMGPDDPMLQNYTTLMVETAVMMGADRKRAEKEMYEAMELELRLVNFSAEEMVRRDPERSNNKFQLWQLRDKFPLIDFSAYVHRMFDGIVPVTGNDTVIIREIEYFQGVQHILSRTSKRVLANYLSWRVVQGFAPFLPTAHREHFYQFKANQTGMFNSPPPDRWEDCVGISVLMMDMPVGKLFVEHFFDKERAMAKMTELTTYLKNEFIKQLETLDWMDERTRRRAIDKAYMIEYKSGFPRLIFDDTWMDEHWGIDIGVNEFLLHLTIRIKSLRYVEELQRLNQPLDRSNWYQSPAQVDAYYAPNTNEMIFPAGIMQFPFLTLGVPNYITYAMVGAVIGHEVSHAFDDQGGRYDELGNLNDWWDAETAEKFAEKTRCFVRQYESVKVHEAGIHLNGQLSLGENIADNGGVKTAFNAYKAWRSNTTVNEAALPGFQNYTSEQMFFLAYANNWCSMVRPKHYIQLIMTDVHAPSKYRAVIPLRNRAEFAEAWQCAAHSAMNPRDKCQVW